MTGLANGITIRPNGEEGGPRVDGAEVKDLVDGDGEEIRKGCGQRGLIVGHRFGSGDGGGKSGHGGVRGGVEGAGALTGNRHCRGRLWCRRRRGCFQGKDGDGLDGGSKNLSTVPP